MYDFPSYRLLDIKGEYRNTAMKLLPCNTLSKIHDLNCGHRVQQSEARNVCGSNCKHDSQGGHAFAGSQRHFRQGFSAIACTMCIFRGIAVEKGIDILGRDVPGLGLMSTAKVRYNKYVDEMTAQGYRRAEPMVSMDNLAELVRQNPQVVVGADGVPDMQIILDGLVISTDVELDGASDDFDEAGLDIVWVEGEM